MTVYVVEQGCYEQRGVAGVFSTLKAAMSAYPEGEWKLVEMKWKDKIFVSWSNGLDWEHAASIDPYELDPVAELPVDAVALERERLGIHR